MSAVEGYTVNGSAGNSAPVGGRRMKMTKKKVMKLAKKFKLLGGEAEKVADVAETAADDAKKVADTVAAPMGGRRRSRKHTKKTHRGGKKHRRSLFGMKY